MTYSSRFWLYAPLALFLALALWAMAHWWSVASALDRKLTLLNGHQAIPGVTVSWARQTISGFPFRVDVVFDNFKLRAEAPRGAVSWASEHFASHALTYGRTQVIFEAAGRQSLDWTGLDGQAHHLSFLPGTLRASAIADGKGLSRFDLDLVGAGGKKDDGSAFSLTRAQFHMRRDPKEDALDLMLSAVETKGLDTPFGDPVTRLEVYSRVTAAHDFRRLLAGRSGWMDALMAWRHDQGKIESGPVHVAGALTADSANGLEDRLRALFFPFY